MAERKYIKNLVGDTYKTWKKGDAICFDASTGSGKTEFCLSILSEFARLKKRKITYLVNRTALREDIERKIADKKVADVVQVYTYQKIESDIKGKRDLPDNFYVVADECHYFSVDSYTAYTDLSYLYVKGRIDHGVVIYMSATADLFFGWLKRKNIVSESHYFHIERNYDYVQALYVYHDKTYLRYIIDKIMSEKSGNKAVVFCNSKERIKEMYSIYGDEAAYTCSNTSSDKDLKKICSSNVIENGILCKQLLFTTSTLDNGVDIKDKKLKYIINELFDADSIIQAYGRKRVVDYRDKCVFFLFNHPKQDVHLMNKENETEYQLGREYKDDTEAFIQKHIEDRRFLAKYPIFYQGYGSRGEDDIRLNNIMWTRKYEVRKRFQSMKENGYLCTTLELLGEALLNKVAHINEWLGEDNPYIRELMKWENRPIYSEDRQAIKDAFIRCGETMKTCGITEMNKVIEKHCDGYKYRFANKDSQGDYFEDRNSYTENGERNPHNRKKYWRLLPDSN